MNPKLKFVLSAIATGLVAFLTVLTTSMSWDTASIAAAGAAALAAIVQYLTPLSPIGFPRAIAAPPPHPLLETHGTFTHMKLGRASARRDLRTLQLVHYLTTRLPSPPATLDLSHGIKFPMYGNDRLGDCTIAAAGHMIQAWTKAAGRLVTVITSIIEHVYWRTGTPPSNSGQPGGPTDTGRVELDVLNYFRKTGIGGHKITAYAAIRPTDHNTTRLAAWLFGGLYLGIALPLTAQTQHVWDVVGDGKTGDSAPGSWGGHAVDVVGYNDQGLTVVTWGALILMTWAFVDAYVEEEYALISPDWKPPAGFDIAQLSADLKQITA